MSISSVQSSPPVKLPESIEPKGPELKSDGDSDDAGASRAPVQASPPPGQGKYVNKTA
jgi:hypothetical protein